MPFQRFRHLVPFYVRRRWVFLAGVACLLLVNGLQQFLPLLLKKAVDDFKAGASLSLIALWVVLRLGVVVGMGGLRYGWRMGLFGLARKAEHFVRSHFFGRLLAQPPAFFQRWRLGELLTRANSDIASMREFTGMGLLTLLDGASLVPLTIWAMARLEPRLTFYCLLPLFATPVLVVTLGRVVNRLNHEAQAALDDLSQDATESFSGVRVVQAYARQSAEIQRFDNACLLYREKNIRVTKLTALYWPMLTAFSGISSVILFWMGGAKVASSSTFTVGSLLALIAYLEQITWPVMALGYTINLYQRGKTSAERLNPILEAIPEILDRRQQVEVVPGTQTREGASPEPVEGVAVLELAFDSVSFEYSHGRPVLSGISFTLKPGEWIGLAGRTGAGKTSLVQLIPRFSDPVAGRILLGGRDLKDWLLPDLRGRMGYVSQDAFLFSDTIAGNIAFGDPGAPHERVVSAAKAADLHGTVAEFPAAYDTLLGERGINLSGGQKQRVAIARALCVQPGLLLLDDPFSAVDTSTEEKILGQLRRAAKGCSVLLVSHRISTLKACDRVLVLEKGVIAEQGSHRDLLSREGIYFQMARREQIARQIGIPG